MLLHALILGARALRSARGVAAALRQQAANGAAWRGSRLRAERSGRKFATYYTDDRSRKQIVTCKVQNTKLGINTLSMN